MPPLRRAYRRCCNSWNGRGKCGASHRRDFDLAGYRVSPAARANRSARVGCCGGARDGERKGLLSDTA
jgi:hypothetical protein